MSWLFPGLDMDIVRDIRNMLPSFFHAVVCEPFYFCCDTIRLTFHIVKFLAFFVRQSCRRLFTRRWNFEKTLCIIAMLDTFICRQYGSYVPQGPLLAYTYRWALYSWRGYSMYIYLYSFSRMLAYHSVYMCYLTHPL